MQLFESAKIIIQKREKKLKTFFVWQLIVSYHSSKLFSLILLHFQDFTYLYVSLNVFIIIIIIIFYGKEMLESNCEWYKIWSDISNIAILKASQEWTIDFNAELWCFIFSFFLKQFYFPHSNSVAQRKEMKDHAITDIYIDICTHMYCWHTYIFVCRYFLIYQTQQQQ